MRSLNLTGPQFTEFWESVSELTVFYQINMTELKKEVEKRRKEQTGLTLEETNQSKKIIEQMLNKIIKILGSLK